MIKGDSLGYYEVLEVSPEDGDETIKQQYHQLAKKWHPDRNTTEEAAEKFQKISIAYSVLKDIDLRLKYDLLSQIYDKKHFPDMKNLKIYTNRSGNQEIDLRHIELIRVTGKIIKHTEKKITEICNYKEAKNLALKTAIWNWLFGWWSLSAIPTNIKAITNNYKYILNDRKGNLTLLIHNMLAYAQEKRYDEAHASGRLALRYADAWQKQLVQQCMDTLPYQRTYIYPQWKVLGFRLVQIWVPIIILMLALFGSGKKVMSSEEFKNLWTSNNKINYFQEVRFSDGGRTVDDVAVSKVASIPVDTEDASKLYHVTQDSEVMYGPDKNFDVLAEISARTTVRLTGYTPDEQWVRIMLDSGEMGFVERNMIRRGIGKAIPENSQIYTGSGI